MAVSTHDSYAFNGCGQVAGSSAINVSSAAKSSYGFYDCTELSGCKAYDIETSINNALYKAVGFQDCDQLSACTADTIAASANAYSYGFNTCKRLSACYAVTITAATAARAYGYYTCTHMDGSCEAASVDDFEFYTCSNEPFKGNAGAATPYGYTEVYTSQTVLNGSTVTYTPAKDCLLFGYMRAAAATWTILTVRNGASGKTIDQVHTASVSYNSYISFFIPVKAGKAVYFAISVTTGYFTLREMPFGTTT